MTSKKKQIPTRPPAAKPVPKVKSLSRASRTQSADEDGEIPEPLDVASGERKLVTQPYDYSVDQLVTHIRKGKIVVTDVPYQREYVWDDAKASRLIESLLLNVPIPVCYFSENDDGSWEVVDGLQRVRSIARFLEGKFQLSGLSVLTELNGLAVGEIPSRDVRRIESRTLRFVVITQESHPDIKFDVFERLNTGSVKLLPQELRNCIYRGDFNEALHATSKDKAFRAALGRPRDARMRDEEMVLRFLALFANIRGYKPPLAQFLNEYMREHRNKSPSESLLETFRDTMRTIADVLGSTAFSMNRDGKPHINRALFDAVSVSFAFADRTQIRQLAAAVNQEHVQLVQEVDFQPLVARATADRARMHARVRVYTARLTSLGISSSLPDLPQE